MASKVAEKAIVKRNGCCRGACHFRKYARPPSTHAEQVIYFKTAVKTCYARGGGGGGGGGTLPPSVEKVAENSTRRRLTRRVALEFY
jgi:hypothetical protein